MELGGSRPGKGLVDAPATLASLLPCGSIQKEAAREQLIPSASQGTPTHSPDFPRKSPSIPFPARPSGSTERAFPSPPPRARARGILPLFPSASARPLSETVRKLLPFFFCACNLWAFIAAPRSPRSEVFFSRLPLSLIAGPHLAAIHPQSIPPEEARGSRARPLPSGADSS